MARQTPASSIQQKRWGRDVRRGVGLVLVVLLVMLAIHVGYELSHDLPNPYWGTLRPMYSYTPEQGPPSASLLETRPDAITAQFLTDYIHVAGTFPCVGSLADYQRYDSLERVQKDPVLNGSGQACTVHRPVAKARITLVEMIGHLKSIPGIWQPEVLVHYQLQYSDGEHFDGMMHLFPDRMHSQPYYHTYIHDNCWDLFESHGHLYPQQVQRVPIGLQYFDGTQDRCSGYD